MDTVGIGSFPDTSAGGDTRSLGRGKMGHRHKREGGMADKGNPGSKVTEQQQKMERTLDSVSIEI